MGSPRRRHSAPACRRLRCESLEARQLLSVTAAEQEFVYLVNLARHDPVAYSAEQNLRDSSGTRVTLDDAAPRGPLAVNNELFASSGFHAEEMAARNYFGHQSAVSGAWPNKMARDQGYVLPSTWSDDANNIESIAAGYSTTLAALNGLLIDEGVPSLGHRRHLLGMGDFYGANREIGVGYGYSPTATYRWYWAIHAARTSTADRFLTGVVYSDLDADGRYDAGEGLGGVTIAAAGRTTTTNAQGGWSIKVPTGSYIVSASGGSFSGTATAVARIGNENTEVDFISGQSLGYVNFERSTTSVTPLGAVDYRELTGQNPSAGDLWYEVEAFRNGTLTIEATAPGAASGPRLSLYDANGAEIAWSDAAHGVARLDYTSALAGQKFSFKLESSAAAVDLRVANLFTRSTPASIDVAVFGTAETDNFVFTWGAPQHEISINGLGYRFGFSPGQNGVVTIDGLGNPDTISITGSSEPDTANYVDMTPNGARLTVSGAANLTVDAIGVPHITAFSTGGQDVARLNDSSGNDTYRSTPSEATLFRNGVFSQRAVGFPITLAYAKSSATDHDTAEMIGSDRADLFRGSIDEGMLRGNGYLHRVKFFNELQVIAGSGRDRAIFKDSDAWFEGIEFHATPRTGTVSGGGYVQRATDFDVLTVYAVTTLNRKTGQSDRDRATFSDDPAVPHNDVFRGTSVKSELYRLVDGAKVYSMIAQAFDEVLATASNGFDKAQLVDSAGPDLLEATPERSTITHRRLGATGAPVVISAIAASGFDRIDAGSVTGGADVATILDTSGDDRLVAVGVLIQLFSNGSARPTYWVSNYSSVTATRTQGNDSASVERADYPVLLGGWLVD